MVQPFWWSLSNMQNQYSIKNIHDKKQCISIIAINNFWNTDYIKILHAECDDKFHFKWNILSWVPKRFEPSHEWVLTKLKYQEPEFYATLFYESEEVTFEVPLGSTKVGVMRKPVHGVPKFYVLH